MANAPLIIGTIIICLIPIYRSGLREGMNMPAWIANHTVFGPPSEYIPVQYYLPDIPIPAQEGVLV